MYSPTDIRVYYSQRCYEQDNTLVTLLAKYYFIINYIFGSVILVDFFYYLNMWHNILSWYGTVKLYEVSLRHRNVYDKAKECMKISCKQIWHSGCLVRLCKHFKLFVSKTLSSKGVNSDQGDEYRYRNEIKYIVTCCVWWVAIDFIMVQKVLSIY